MQIPSFLTLPDGKQLAYHKFTPATADSTPGIFFLGGYASDMNGSKAVFLDGYSRRNNLPFIRLDYSGHGQSSGIFTEGCISEWAEDALAVFDAITDPHRKYILVGSSMGGWIMLLLAQQRLARIHSLLGIAAAPDFTEDLMWQELKPEHQHQLMAEGLFHLPPEYCTDPSCEPSPYPITRKLIEDGRKNLLLRGDILPIACPVRLLHGLEDKDVPYRVSLRLAEKLASSQVTITLLKGAGHRMSTPEQLEAITHELHILLQE